MKINPLYAYLEHVYEAGHINFPLEKKQSQKGFNYFFIKLPQTQATLKHKTLGQWRVLENHLTCFSSLEAESFYSDIHYTLILQQQTETVKIHVYLDKHGDVAGFYARKMPSSIPIDEFKIEDIWSLFITSTANTQMIRQGANQLLQSMTQAYQTNVQAFEDVFFNQSMSKIDLDAALGKIIVSLEKLRHFDARYQKKYQRFVRMQKTLNAAVEPEVLTPPKPVEIKEVIPEDLFASTDLMQSTAESVKSEVLVDNGLGLIQQIKDNIFVLKKVLDQQIEKITRQSDQPMRINRDYQGKIHDILGLFDQINGDLLLLDERQVPENKSFLVIQMHLQFEALSATVFHYANEYFETMVLCNELSDYPFIALMLEKPKISSLVFLIRHQAIAILIDILKRHPFSLLDPIFVNKQQNLIEYLIAGYHTAVFAAVMDVIPINFLQTLEDGRPLACVILSLSPHHPIRQKCLSDHHQFSSKSFYNQLKSKIEPLLLTHPKRIELQEIFQVLDILKKNAGSASDPQRSTDLVVGKHQEFFSSLRPHLEEMSFLKKPHFVSLIGEYEQLAQKQKSRAELLRQTPLRRQAHREFLSDFCTEDMKQRMERLLPGLDEESAYISMQISLEIAKHHDSILEIDEELKKSSLSLRQKKQLVNEKTKHIQEIVTLEQTTIQSAAHTDARVAMVTLVKNSVFAQMSEEDKSATASYFEKETEEKPLQFYTGLPGLSQAHLRCIRSIRQQINGYCSHFKVKYIESVLTALEELNQMLEQHDLPAETLAELNDFYVHETNKLFH